MIGRNIIGRNTSCHGIGELKERFYDIDLWGQPIWTFNTQNGSQQLFAIELLGRPNININQSIEEYFFSLSPEDSSRWFEFQIRQAKVLFERNNILCTINLDQQSSNSVHWKKLPNFPCIIELTHSHGHPDFSVIAEIKGNPFFSVVIDDYDFSYDIPDETLTQLDGIKLDTSVVEALQSKGARQDTLRKLNNLRERLRKMGQAIVFEGIETNDDIDLVGCDELTLLQGYYFKKPEPIESLINSFAS